MNGDNNDQGRRVTNRQIFEHLRGLRKSPTSRTYVNDVRIAVFTLFEVNDYELSEEANNALTKCCQNLANFIKKKWTCSRSTLHVFYNLAGNHLDCAFPIRLGVVQVHNQALQQPVPQQQAQQQQVPQEQVPQEQVPQEQVPQEQAQQHPVPIQQQAQEVQLPQNPQAQRRVKQRKRTLKKPWVDLSKSGKKKQVREIKSRYSDEAIAAAFKSTMRSKGCRKSSTFLVDSMLEEDGFAKKADKAVKTPVPTKMTVSDALAESLDQGTSRSRFQDKVRTLKRHNVNIYPGWKKQQEHRDEIIPDDIEYAETEAKVNMESLLKNTVDRHLLNEQIRSKLVELKEEKGGTLQVNLVFKFGLDGSGDQKKYKQVGANCDNVLASQMCPLRLVDADTNEVIFENPLANVPNSHRPIRISYEPETRESVEMEYERIKEEIERLLPYSPIDGVTINWIGLPTLCDGKVLTFILDEKAYSSCPLCGGKEKAISTKGQQFKLKKKVKNKTVNVLRHGLAPTHTWIRSITFILNLGAYSLIKKPKVQNDNDKNKRAKRQNEIAKKIWDKLRITVFGKGPHGGGCLDGNTARILYENAEFLSEVTTVPLDLILALRKLCRGAASSRPIDPQKFQRAANDFKRLYFEKYMGHDRRTAWYFLPSTIHKIIEHGAQIIEELPVPPGLAGEEGSEGQNKYFRSIRQNLTCKTSAARTIKDLFKRLMAKSDPVMCEYVTERVLRKRKSQNIPDDLKELLTDSYLESIAIPQENEEEDMDHSDDEESDSDEMDVDGDQEEMEVDND